MDYHIPLLCYHRLRCYFQAQANIHLPAYKGSAWRGLFGHALKKVICPFQHQMDCQSCELAHQCFYLQLFETPSQTSIKTIANGTTHLPHPFILTPPLDVRSVIPQGECFFAEITLLAPAFFALPYLICTFEMMGQIGIGTHLAPFDFFLMQVYDNKKWNTLFDKAQGELLQLPSPMQPQSPHWQQSPSYLTIHFLTPIHIKSGKHKINELSFVVFITALSRRIRHLIQLYGDVSSAINVQPLIAAARQISVAHSQMRRHKIPRFSQRQQVRMTFEGLIGNITYQGNFTPYAPWLIAGEALHLGNLTSFGFGKYQLEWND
jgi:hypothetical protein